MNIELATGIKYDNGEEYVILKKGVDEYSIDRGKKAMRGGKEKRRGFAKVVIWIR